MCCFAFGFPVKNEVPAIAIPITESNGRITPVSFVLIPNKLVSSPACARSGTKIPIAATIAKVITICFLFIRFLLFEFFLLKHQKITQLVGSYGFRLCRLKNFVWKSLILLTLGLIRINAHKCFFIE